MPRLRKGPRGDYTWLAEKEALIETVRQHRSRSYWSEWEALRIPALLVRGERSNELRPAIAAQMRQRNPSVQFREIADTGHNIPLLAPAALAAILHELWGRAEGPRT